jgi:hypothetical protein
MAPAVDPAPPALATPPRTETESGQTRRLGIEIEFDGLDCEETGSLLHRLFGGQIHWRDPYRVEIRNTRLGDFEVELDMSMAHPEGHPKRPSETPKAEDSEWERRAREEFENFLERVEAELAEAVGDLGSLWMPVEIVAPPIPWDRLPELDRLIAALRDAGAGGTRSGLLSAYGTQLNPEVASTEPDYLLAVLRAYLLLSDWLREEIGVDLRRRVTPFVDPFPGSYADLVLDPGYAPDLGRLVGDYLVHNATRNRELDLLPLFDHLASAQVRRRLPREKIHARPTFHYRLPDTRLDKAAWSLTTEWNRWVTVERLAENKELLAEGMARFRAYRRQFVPLGWPAESRSLAWALMRNETTP